MEKFRHALPLRGDSMQNWKLMLKRRARARAPRKVFAESFSEKSDRFDCTSTKRRLWQLHRKRPPSKSDVENIERGGEVE